VVEEPELSCSRLWSNASIETGAAGTPVVKMPSWHLDAKQSLTARAGYVIGSTAICVRKPHDFHPWRGNMQSGTQEYWYVVVQPGEDIMVAIERHRASTGWDGPLCPIFPELMGKRRKRSKR